jgi:uncharacterized protein DUF5666
MRRFVAPALVPLLLVLAACAGNVSASAQPKASPSPGRGFRNGAAGQLVKITGATLILSGRNGDTTVDFDSSTRITRTSTASVADIAPGTCIVATGQKDAGGVVTATRVRITPATNGSCAGPVTGQFGGGGGGGFPGFATPRPGRPTPPADFGFAAGLVTAVSGTSITVKAATGATSTVTVPTTVGVSKTSEGKAADLQIGECVAAAGPRDASGTVKARMLTISPPSASGSCSTFGGGGGFFFGGGGAGGGAGG